MVQGDDFYDLKENKSVYICVPKKIIKEFQHLPEQMEILFKLSLMICGLMFILMRILMNTTLLQMILI